MAKELKVTTKYKKDLKAYKHRPDVLLELNKVIDILISGGTLPEKYKNHPLSGNFKDIYDCHVKPNDVLLYKINETEVTLIRFGPHNKLELTENNKKGFDNMIKLHIKEEYDEEASSDIMTLLKNIPNEDIDHHETDLYLRKTPEVTKNVINKLPDIYKKNVTTFRDQIDHDIWYEIPFVFPKGKVRKPTNESKERYSIENLKKLIRVILNEKGFKVGAIRYNNTKNTLAIPMAEENEDSYQWETIATAIGKFIDFDDMDSVADYAEATVDEVIQRYYDLVESVLTENEDAVETWDVSFWDAEEQESYDTKTVHMTKDEVKDYVAKLNAKRTEREKENGSFYDYVLA